MTFDCRPVSGYRQALFVIRKNKLHLHVKKLFPVMGFAV